MRPRGPSSGAALTWTEISSRTGIPRSTVYDTYRRIEERLVIVYLVRCRWRAANKLASA